MRKGFMNLSLQDHQVSLVAICSDTFPHLMDILSGVGRIFSSLSWSLSAVVNRSLGR